MAKKTTRKKAGSRKATSKKKAKTQKRVSASSKPSGKASGKKSPATKAKSKAQASAPTKGKANTKRKSTSRKAKPGGAAASSAGVTGKPTKTKSKSSAGKPSLSQISSEGGVIKVKSKAKPVATVKVNGPRWSAREPSKPKRSGPLPDSVLRKIKTELSRQEILHYKQTLMERRAQILGDVESLRTESLSQNEGGNLSTMPVHMADIGTDNYEQEFTLGLIESDRKLLREIEDALGRIVNKTYGVCVESGEPIGKSRLDAKPWAKYCIEVAREKERTGQV